MSTTISTGVCHRVPKDLRTVLEKHADLRDIWSSLTPLARNEWICWLTIVKKDETRKKHLKQLQENLRDGKRRPCCWPGCPHRNPNSAKWFGKKK